MKQRPSPVKKDEVALQGAIFTVRGQKLRLKICSFPPVLPHQCPNKNVKAGGTGCEKPRVAGAAGTPHWSCTARARDTELGHLELSGVGFGLLLVRAHTYAGKFSLHFVTPRKQFTEGRRSEYPRDMRAW